MSRDGSERARLRRCIRIVGPDRAAKALGIARATATGYASDAPVNATTEIVIVLRLPELEASIANETK